MMPVYSIQSQSTLFRLPRELRDQIYEYYLRAENGSFYDPHTEKMMDSYPSFGARAPQVVNIGLIWTCKIAAEETKCIGLRHNEVVFHAMCSVNDGDGCLDLNSKAGRFKSRMCAFS
jgi:hypothetical protein